MLFSSISFLYYFFPIVLILYFLAPQKLKNIVLLFSSLLFYFLGEPVYILILIFSTISDYLHGLIIEKNRGKIAARLGLISSLIINLSILVFFKYWDFIIINVNSLFNTDFKILELGLPLGISFFTFQTMSYTIDVYRGEVKGQKELLTLATYVTLFPQLIAGPIVRYKTVSLELSNRELTFDNISYGIRRFIIGLSKKVLLANTLGELSVISKNANNDSVLFYWLFAISFTLQIYFDFSGYSDMAIGLGRIFGFHFLENFNYPLISNSITEFWRRWHISLGTWFKDYVYIPLGGNKVSKIKWYRNKIIVWLLTGLWHGASWNFIIWGLYFGIILIIEKLVLLKILNKTPKLINHLYVIFLVIFGFVIFSNEKLSQAIHFFKGMLGLLNIPIVNFESIYYLNSYRLIIIVAIIGSTPLIKAIIQHARLNTIFRKVISILEPITYLTLLVVITGYLVD